MDTEKKESMTIKLLHEDHSNAKCEHRHSHDHHHSQHKHLHHHHDQLTMNENAKRKLVIVCCVCCAFMLVEIIGGLISNSLAIMTDAAHLLSDLTGFVISIYALSIAKRPPDKLFTFGYHRAEIVGAISSVFIIWILTALLLTESIERILDSHHQLDGQIMLITSSIGLVFNGVMAYILHSSEEGGCHGHSHNEISLMQSQQNNILASDSPKYLESPMVTQKKKLNSCFQKKQFLEEFGISKTAKSVRINPDFVKRQIEEVSSEDGGESITNNKKSDLKKSSRSTLNKEADIEMDVIPTKEKECTQFNINENATPVKCDENIKSQNDHAKEGHLCSSNKDKSCAQNDTEYKMLGSNSKHKHASYECSHHNEKEIQLNYHEGNEQKSQHACNTEEGEDSLHQNIGRNLNFNYNFRITKDSAMIKKYTHDFSVIEKIDYLKRQSDNIPMRKPRISESLSLKSPGLERRHSKLHNLDVFLGFNKNCLTSSSSCHSSDDDSDHLENGIHFPEGPPSQDQSRIVDTSSHLHESVQVDPPTSGKSHKHNINVQAAMIHIIGDIIQSIGVIIAALLIYFFPQYQVLDSITTVLFSIIVIFTTLPIVKQCVQVVMEGNVHATDLDAIKKVILQTPGVDNLTCMHLFSLSLEKPVLIAQVKATLLTSETELLDELYSRISKFSFYHCAIEITKEAEIQKRKCNNVLSL